MSVKTTVAANNRPVLWIYGPIGEHFGGISPNEVRQALSDIPENKEIDVRIHSDGGSFPDSIAIYSNFTRRKGRTNMFVDGKAYSGGSVIAMAGTRIQMATGSWMMFHEASQIVEGTATDHRAAAERLDAINDQLVQIYMKRWKGSEKELRNALAAETWLPDSEAVTMGLADSVDDAQAVAAYVDPKKFGYRNVPDAVLQAKDGEIPVLPGLVKAGAVIEDLFGSKEDAA